MSFPYVRFTENRSLEEARRLFEQRIADALAFYVKHGHTFTPRSCPVCGSSRGEAVTRFHDTYEVVCCGACASAFVNPAPSLEALSDYYNNSPCNILLDDIYRNRASKPTDPINDERVVKVLEYVGLANNPARVGVLEIGCGSGSFLSKLRRAVDGGAVDGVHVEAYRGIDIDANAVARNLDQRLHLTASSVEDHAREHSSVYDLIVHFELLEHLTDPTGFMQSARRLLTADGVMIFTTPNADGLEMVCADHNAYRLLAHSIFPPMHLNAFSTANVTHFALRNGFSVLDIQTPGQLDVDMVTVMRNHLVDDAFCALADLPEDTKAVMQQVLVRCKASSHMQCVLRKSPDPA